jgi:hypothetical protein
MGEGRFVSLTVAAGESDLWVGLSPEADASSAASALPGILADLRAQVASWASDHPTFSAASNPCPTTPRPRPWSGTCSKREWRRAWGPWRRWPAPSPRCGRSLAELVHPGRWSWRTEATSGSHARSPSCWECTRGFPRSLAASAWRSGACLPPGVCTSSARWAPPSPWGTPTRPWWPPVPPPWPTPGPRPWGTASA